MVDNRSSPEAKIELFRSLFRGREDIYPRRFESRKTGRAGYAPACANEWVSGVCEKPKVKCAECIHRQFLPVTDEVVRWHLTGSDGQGKEFVMGVYPMLLDETCFFLAVDFDKQEWRQDALAYLETCRIHDVPAVLEKSRSGNGGHVWVFFDRAVPAILARKLGAFLLTETMERRPDVGFDSYDRFFPNQDTLPQGGFGNLIALPLQRKVRERGNSVFLDERLEPYLDQWAFMATIRRFSLEDVQRVVGLAQEKGRVIGVPFVAADDDANLPWMMAPSRKPKPVAITGKMPEQLELVLSDMIYLAKSGLPAVLRNRLLHLVAFQNPEFYKAQAMRLSTYDKPRIIACAEDHPSHIGLPRGSFEEIEKLLDSLNIRLVIKDERMSGEVIDVKFQGKLRPEQKPAGTAMLAHETGILSATTAFGKTVLAAWLIAQRGVNTLVLVHRKQLLEQWTARLGTFLSLPAKSIGQIGGGRKKPTGIVDVAIIQSLVRKGVVDDQVAKYGHVIVDECHHLSAQSFEQVIKRCKAKYVMGLSATISRKDGHHPIIFMQCGPVRYRVDAKEQAAARPFEHKVLVRPTGFRTVKSADPDIRVQFQDLYGELITNEARNGLIVAEVVRAAREGRSPIVLTERNEHLDKLMGMLQSEVKNLIVLRGGMSRKQIKSVTQMLETLPVGEERVVVATGKYIGEGFDDARLDTLFLTLPVSWHGTVAQYVGRLHRLHDQKKEVRVYDYADLDVPMLARMFDRRCRGYEAVGYSILLPASAIPGWPTDVPLPVEPEWKRDYSGSVQRLVRDGVDSGLANLFVHVARVVTPDSEGIQRARSATEAFLYRRLETLKETKGKLQLNVKLPIAFDTFSQLEADFLCPEAKLVIELDGGQHLQSVEAYRSDRRKDMLLQENGYFVLRFLAEDVGKRLNEVLDAVLRVMNRRDALGAGKGKSRSDLFETTKVLSLPVRQEP
jgi:superfamily II DNA or RNA helicase/very-short-patch-repair endonuclease